MSDTHAKTDQDRPKTKDRPRQTKPRTETAARTETSAESNARESAERSAFAMRETRRVPLRAALSGSAAVDNAHALKYDVKSLRVFLEPWVLTDGKDPKSACRDPRVAAARAAGDDDEATRLYEQLPKSTRGRPLTLQEQIHG